MQGSSAYLTPSSSIGHELVEHAKGGKQRADEAGSVLDEEVEVDEEMDKAEVEEEADKVDEQEEEVEVVEAVGEKRVDGETKEDVDLGVRNASPPVGPQTPYVTDVDVRLPAGFGPLERVLLASTEPISRPLRYALT